MRLPVRTWRGIVVAAAALPLAGCDLPGFGMPDSASKEGDSILSLWQGFFLAAMGVGALVWGLLIYVLLRFRRRSDDVPSQKPYNIPMEVIYTATPVVAVAILFGFSVVTESDVTGVDDDPDAIEVEVVGFQWSWEFHYPDEGITLTGEPGNGPEMVLPVGRPAHLTLSTTDVNHSFWVPDFLSKRDLIEDVSNEIQVTPTKKGSYVGRCAEFCGLDHWRMNYTVRVVAEADYESWLEQQRSP